MTPALRRLLLKLYNFLRPAPAERELSKEIDSHLQLLEDEHARRGMAPEEARLAARRAFGGVELAKERARDERSFLWLEDARRDIRLALRSLGRAPGFVAVAVLTLAVGIGGTTAVFTVLEGIVLEPLPFPAADELVSVMHSMPGVGADEAPLSRAMYLTYREHATTIEDIGLWKRTELTVTGEGEPERVEALLVSDGVFTLLGVRPHLGRGYVAEDGAPGSENPVLLGWGYWQSRFGGDRGVVGRTLRVNGHDLPIIGVLPDGVHFEDPPPALYLPLVIDPARTSVGSWSFPGVARLKRGVGRDQVERDLNRLTAVATEKYPGIPLEELEARDFRTFVRPLKESLLGSAGTVIWIVFGTAGLVLVISCVNVASLFLVRAEVSRRDATLRTALGASRARLTRQFLAESLVIGVLGGGLGVLAAYGGVQLFLSIAPTGLPRLGNVSLDESALLFALVVSLVASVLFGLIPAFRSRRRDLAATLKEGGRGRADSGPRLLRNAFVVSQVALALVLLVASGLMLRSFQALGRVPPGFQEPQEVITFRISIPSSEVESGEETARAHQTILEKIAALPGVVSASAAMSVAMDGWDSWEDVFVEEFPELDSGNRPFRRMNWVAPGYFATLRNPLLAGRDIAWSDLYERRPVVVVTENFAREFWQEPSRAIGKRIRTHENYPWSEIVGVSGDEHTKGVHEPAPSVFYFPFFLGQFWEKDYVWRNLRYVVRTSREDAKLLVPEAREAVWSVSANLPLFQIATLEEILARSLSQRSFTFVVLTIAAGIALVLGMVGVYGVVSSVVAQRTREMGLRMALGARPADVRGMILLQGGTLGVAGILLGLAAAAGLARFLSSLLFEVRPVDPPTYATLALLLGAVVLLASYLPARRASAVDPSRALRWD